MTFADLRLAQPELAAALLETCGGRVALATLYVSSIARLAADAALAAERERCSMHLAAGERGDMALAAEAIRSGAPLDIESFSAHMARIKERRDAPAVRLVAPEKTEANT